MRSWIRMRPALCFFALAFATSWLGILLVIRGGPIPAPPHEANRLFPLVYLAMLAGPSVAGVAMTAVVGGVTSLREYRGRLLAWRVAPRWYAVALLTAPLAIALTLYVLTRFSSDFVPAIFGKGPIDPAGPIQSDSARAIVLAGIAVGIGAGLFEELGWTGFAIPTLLPRFRETLTGVVVGIAWGAWHFLAIWWGSASAFDNVPVPLFLLVALFAFLPPYRMLMVRVYARTQSLLIAILMHASLTTSMIILGPAVNGTNAVIYNFAFAMTLWLIVALLLMAHRGPRKTFEARSYGTKDVLKTV